MQLIAYRQSPYDSDFISDLICLIGTHWAKPWQLSIIFDEFASIVASSPWLVTITGCGKKDISVSSERVRGYGSNHCGHNLLHSLTASLKPSYLLADRNAAVIAYNLGFRAQDNLENRCFGEFITALSLHPRLNLIALISNEVLKADNASSNHVRKNYSPFIASK